MAVADALNKAKYFVLSCPNLNIAVDHKPLLKIFGDRSLEEISNSRLHKLQKDTQMIHVPGNRHHATDGVSSYSTSDVEHGMQLPDDIATISPNADVDVPQLPRPSILASNRTPE